MTPVCLRSVLGSCTHRGPPAATNPSCNKTAEALNPSGCGSSRDLSSRSPTLEQGCGTLRFSHGAAPAGQGWVCLLWPATVFNFPSRALLFALMALSAGCPTSSLPPPVRAGSLQARLCPCWIHLAPAAVPVGPFPSHSSPAAAPGGTRSEVDFPSGLCRAVCHSLLKDLRPIGRILALRALVLGFGCIMCGEPLPGGPSAGVCGWCGKAGDPDICGHLGPAR